MNLERNINIAGFHCHTINKTIQQVKSRIKEIKEIEDITWPRGDTEFLFECRKIFHE